MLPATLGGVSLTIESQAGTDLATRSAAFDAFLAGLGRTRADFTVASAYSPGGLRAEVGGWRVKGADRSLLLPRFRTAVQASSATPLTQVEESFAGRMVTRIGDPGQWRAGRSTSSCAATPFRSCRPRSAPSPWRRTSCRSRTFGASPALIRHSSALTMKPASTSSVAEVT